MTILIGQIMGCLLVAAAIGGAVGWLMRNLSATTLKQQYLELNSALRSKEQALQTALYDLKVKASAMQILQSNIISAEAMVCSTQQELSAQNERLQPLQKELAVRTQRLTLLEAEEVAVRRRASEYDAAAAVHSEEVRQFHLARQAAQQALDSKEQERRDLQHRVAELEATVAEADQLRARLEELNQHKDGSIG
jgi:chromosome segregation ATPase